MHKRTRYCLRYQILGGAECFVERCSSMTERELRRLELAGRAVTLEEWLESPEQSAGNEPLAQPVALPAGLR